MIDNKLPCPICNKKCSNNIQENYTDCCISDDDKNYCICDDFGKIIIHEKHGINEENRHIVAGYLYETRNRDKPFEINSENVIKILSDPLIPKTSIEKFNKLLLSYYNILNAGIGFFNAKNYPPSIAYAESFTQIESMIQALIKEGYLSHTKIDRNTGDPIDIYFTLKGLQYCESLLSSNQSKKVFVAMTFDDEMRSMHENAIKPACAECGFSALTVDEKEHNDDIPDKIISEIKTSHFVVADFTYNNQGVYFEAGYAKGLGLPVIKTCKKSWFDETDENGNRKNNLHFDIEHDNLILWENEEHLKERLENRIRATIL
ncbi:MAG: hypothetical protein PHV39_09060 [Methanomicrobium sp.]|nr:hypothetical protein [Methanomicrobium sp.]